MNSKGVLWTLLALIVALLAGVSYFYYQETQKSLAQQKGLDKITDEAAKFRQKITELEGASQNAESEKKKLQEALAKEKETLSQQLAEQAESSKRDANYKQQIEQLNQALEKLKKESAGASLKEDQIRLQADFQKRLKTLAAEKERELQQTQATYQSLMQNLKQEVDDKSVTIEQYKEKLTIKMVDRILFGSGSTRINESGIKVLKTIGNILKTNLDGRQVRVEGHTDNMPISSDKLKQIYPTNWELSTARAVRVVRHLQEHAGIPPEKINAAGFGEYHPLADNATPEGQAQNRRIEIVLTPELMPAPAPAQAVEAPTPAPAVDAPTSAPAAEAPTRGAPTSVQQ